MTIIESDKRQATSDKRQGSNTVFYYTQNKSFSNEFGFLCVFGEVH